MRRDEMKNKAALEKRMSERTGELQEAVKRLESEVKERKRAEERLKEEMAVTNNLLMLSRSIAHITDINAVMDKVPALCRKILGADACLTYLWDDESRSFQPVRESGLHPDLIPAFKAEGLSEKNDLVKSAMESDEPLIADLINRHIAFAPLGRSPGINTVSIGSISSEQGPLGLIIGAFEKTAYGPSAERLRNIMAGVCHQVTIAVEQARLHRESAEKALELSQKIETLKVMSEIDKSILSSLEAHEILETTVKMIGRVLPCDRATVALADADKRQFSYIAGFGLSDLPKGALIPYTETSCADVMRTRRTQYVNNMLDIKSPLPFERRLLREGFMSHIRVPLTSRGGAIGVLSVGSKRVAAFSPDDMKTFEKLAAQISVALSNAALIADTKDLFMGTVKSLSAAIDAKSPWTQGHSERVTSFALAIAEEMELDDKAANDIEIAGLLHDVGKIGTYESILEKPGKLTEEEMRLVMLHPGKGADIVSPIKQLTAIIPVIRHHHERYDGDGYPDGLKGEAIPLLARVLAVADTVDAMSADRPYRTGKPLDEIIGEIKRCSGSQFDPQIVRSFLKTIDQKGLTGSPAQGMG